MKFRTRQAAILTLASLAAVAGCKEQTTPAGTSSTPPGRPPAASAGIPATTQPGAALPTVLPEADPTVATFLGFTAPKPATWTAYPPESSMRAANYVVPAASGHDQAHVVVFQGIGGGTDANIERWKGQFRSPEGGPVEAVVAKEVVAGMPVTFVELAGEYMGMGTEFEPDQIFLAAILESPLGDLQIRLVGDTATVNENREAFMTMIRGLKRAG